MPAEPIEPAAPRVVVDGKFFRAGGRRFHPKGVTYGPFAPGADGAMFPAPDTARRDFALVRELGANVLRVYHVPPRWLLDLAEERGLKLLVDIPWDKDAPFLATGRAQAEARRAVRAAVGATKNHPAIFAYSVVNEISAGIVEVFGARRVERFIDVLVGEAKAADPQCLCTFASFPPTDFLRPRKTDFACFNVYLHERRAFEGYLAQLQTFADDRPLLLGEAGMDSMREGREAQRDFLGWQIESAFRAGLAGVVVFSFTDDWFRGGAQVGDWAFGLTTRGREPKESFAAVQRQFAAAPYFPPLRTPRVSVVVATFNGARTLRGCLGSLSRLNYADFEVIVVDDGSADGSAEIAGEFPSVRCIRQPNLGLSAARNTGVRAATGEVVAFTDDDCRVDEDWLFHLVGDLTRGGFAGIGGHNLLPPEDSCVSAAVMASPGGPAHVMLTDLEAEHIPGCNMAFFKPALEGVGGFDTVCHRAGDDVDICWRLQEAGFKVGFSHAGFVWHHRRPTVRAYLRQQSGYGEAEALLMARHPRRFNVFGGGIWKGRIYSASNAFSLFAHGAIYNRTFLERLGLPGLFPRLLLCTTPGWHLCVTLPALAMGTFFSPVLFVGLVAASLSLVACALAGAKAELPPDRRRAWSRPLVASLFFLQPVVRGWTRARTRFATRTRTGS